VKGHEPAQIANVLETLTKGNWLDEERFRGHIIFIYVCPYSTISPKTFEGKVEATVSNLFARGCCIDRYSFCYIDKTDSAKVWGHSLDKLIELLKGKWEDDSQAGKRVLEDESDLASGKSSKLKVQAQGR
jgi:hypothetical protein